MKSPVSRKLAISGLSVLLLVMFYRLLFAEGSFRHVASLERDVASLREAVSQLEERNQLMAADVRDLKEGTEAVEEIARKDLGMIREGETFFLIVDGKQDSQ